MASDMGMKMIEVDKGFQTERPGLVLVELKDGRICLERITSPIPIDDVIDLLIPLSKYEIKQRG